MSNAQQRFNAGQAHGQAQGKTEEWIDSARDTVNAARDNMAHGGQSAARGGGQQQLDRDQSAGGSLQQIKEQATSLAQGAIDGAKDSLGIGDRNQRN